MGTCAGTGPLKGWPSHRPTDKTKNSYVTDSNNLDVAGPFVTFPAHQEHLYRQLSSSTSVCSGRRRGTDRATTGPTLLSLEPE